MKALASGRTWLRMVTSTAMLASVVGLATSVASAQPLTDTLAISFKQQGDSAIAESRFAEAAAAYRQGNQIQHHPSFDFNLARALQGLGRFAEALDALERFDREASTELRAQVPGLPDLLAQLQGNVGELLLDGAGKAAKITGNGQYLGHLRLRTPIRCNRGPLNLRIEADGFEPVSLHVVIEAGQTTRVKLNWVPVDLRAKLTIGASVAAARVSMDGHPLGQTPIDVKVTPGMHRLRLEHPDYQTLETEVLVGERQARTLTLEMSRHAPIWSKWWFWTGVAAVAAGMVVTGVALSTSKSADPGDIQPGIVSAPIVAPR